MTKQEKTVLNEIADAINLLMNKSNQQSDEQPVEEQPADEEFVPDNEHIEFAQRLREGNLPGIKFFSIKDESFTRGSITGDMLNAMLDAFLEKYANG